MLEMLSAIIILSWSLWVSELILEYKAQNATNKHSAQISNKKKYYKFKDEIIFIYKQRVITYCSLAIYEATPSFGFMVWRITGSAC